MTLAAPFVFLTGGSGFLGGTVSRVLEANGVNVLRTQGRDPNNSPENYLDIRNLGVDEIAAKLARDRCAVTLHFATSFTHDTHPSAAEIVCASNFSFAVKVAEASALAGVGTFLNVASTWEWIRSQNPTYKTALTPYSASKQAFRTYLDHRFGSTGFIKNLVIEESLGEGDTREKLIPKLITAGLMGEEFHVRDPKAKMNFADATGLANFLLDNLEDLSSLPNVFGYADYREVPISTIIDELRKIGLQILLANSGESDEGLTTRVTLQSLRIPIYSQSDRTLGETLLSISRSS